MKIDILHSDDEETYNIEDIDVLCKYNIGSIDDVTDIDKFIMENIKKSEKKSYESFDQEVIIKETEIGLDIIKKYQLAISTNTPINFIYKNDDLRLENHYYSIRDELKNKTNITQLIELLYKKRRIKTNEFLFAYYFSNSDKDDKFFVKQFNKLNLITNEEYDEDDVKEKRTQFDKLFDIRMRITENKFRKIKKFYQDLNILEYSNLPEKINNSLILESTMIEIDVLDKENLIDIDLGSIFFNGLSASYIFPFIQLNSFDEKYYKIYEKEKSFSNLLIQKKKLFENLEDENEKNKIFIIMRLERITTLNYVLIEIDLNRSVLRFEYPSDSLIPIKQEILLAVPNIQFKEERIISTNGYFNFNIKNYDEFKFYYLTIFDPIVSKFIYINENKRPRSLKENLKFYFRSYEDSSNIYIDYSIYFYISKIHGNNYEIKFNSKIINQKNIVNEFSLILSKIFFHYQKYDFDQSNLVFIVNQYTGPDGNGLGGQQSEGFDLQKFIPKSKKIDNLISIAPELFPKNDYARQCLCPKQPIIIDDEDISDWEKYGRNVYIFPPLFSKQKSKRYNFVCPTENSIMNFIKNPDIESPFPILPCCSQNKTNEYYRYYDEIIKEGDKFWNIKEEEKSKMIQKKKTISILSTEQEGDVPAELNTFMKKMYPDHNTGNFIRIGVMKNSRSSLIHCLIKACEHLKYMLEIVQKSDNKKYENIFNALIKIRKKYLYAPLTKREVNVIDLRKQLDKFVNLEISKQELYNYNIRQISDILNNQKEVFDSKLLYRLLENIFFVNIFVFEYNGVNQVRLEKPRGRFYNQREIRIGLPTVFIFKHCGKQLPTYELIRNTDLLPDSDKTFLFGNLATKYMKYYIENNGYYRCEYNIDRNEYNITKNYQSSINWNYLLKDYRMVEQFINDSGRTYAINFKTSLEGNHMTIFIPSSFPLNLPEGNTIHISTTKQCHKIFGKDKVIKGSEGLWYRINGKSKAMFIPCSDLKENNDIELICKDYFVSKNIKKKNKINRLNIVKRNTLILVQIILWMWNISEIKTLDAWWEKYVEVSDKQKDLEVIAGNPFKVELRFPNIEDTTEAILYYNHYMPFIFYAKKINLYPQLYTRIYQYIKNYITKTEGYEEKIVNKAIIGIFNNESDFDQKIFNKIIIGEKNFDDWQNFIENINNDYTNLSDNFISQKRPFLYKDENGEIFLIQNNINNNLIVSILICKIWKELKINLGYYTTETNIWKCVKCDPRLYDIFKLSDQKVINLAKKYTPENIRIESFNHALQVLEKENIAFEIDEEDMNYYTKNSQNYINKEHVHKSDPFSLFAYNNGGLASILPIA